MTAVYEPDGVSGQVPDGGPSGRTITVQRSTATSYRDNLESKSEGGRLEVIQIPKTITPKGLKKLESLLCENERNKYDNLRKQLLEENKLYEDPDFPAGPTSLGKLETPTNRIVWKRPKEIIKSAEFISEGVSRFDIKQGKLGDCWLLAVVSSLSIVEDLFNQVVPNDQDMKENYVGAFHFRFWQYGQWTDVIVDDRLPTIGGELAFMHSEAKEEFWSALMEKAYAKLCGSYGVLCGGNQSEAMEDFTGGVCVTIQLEPEQRPPDLYIQMKKFSFRSSLMGCAIEPKGSLKVEQKLPSGLYAGHAYSVTGVDKVFSNDQVVKLVRIRNPWGNAYEWSGDWSDSSNLWNSVSDEEKQRLQFTKNPDGEFWMSFEDFVSNFTKLEVCHLGPESLDEDNLAGKVRWEETVLMSSWTANVNAGGCMNHRATFHTNPQFRIQVVDPDEKDKEDKGSLVIGLMQRDARKAGKTLNIGYAIYAVPKTCTGILDQKFFNFNKRTFVTTKYPNQREVSGYHKFAPGDYVIIPSTFSPKEEGDFMLRLFTQKPHVSSELDEETAMIPVVKELDHSKEKELKEMHTKFSEVSKGTGSIKAHQLQQLLNSSSLKEVKNFTGFSVEVCRSMVALMDHNQTGTLELDEFDELWSDLILWKQIFIDKDVDKSGTFDSFELREALKQSGFCVSNKVFSAIAQRYADPVKEAILFEDFILALIRLKNGFETFSAQPKNERKEGVFVEEDFIRFWMYV